MQRRKSSFIIFLVGAYFVMDIFGMIFFVKPVKAQFGGVVSDPGLYAIIQAQEAKGTILSQITGAAMGALMNSLSYMVRKVAYDTATAIATGDTGLSPLAITKSAANSAADAAGDAVGELIGSLGEPFGLNLCKIPDPQFNINLKLGLTSLFAAGQGGPKPKCEWQDIKDNFSISALEERYGEGGSNFASEIFSGSLSIEQSGFGIALESIAQIDNARSEARTAADVERIANQGFKDIISPISGLITTPAFQIRKESESLSAAEQQKLTASQIAGIYGSELKTLPLMAANIFINTLSQQLLQRVMTGLLPDTPPQGPGGSGSGGTSGPGGGIASFFASTLQDNRKAAQRAFNFLTAPSISQVDNYNIVGDLVKNKVIDSGLEQAINRGKNSGGVFLTIEEAIDQNLLHANWQLIPPTHALNSSEDRDCYIKGYCYSNIQKLRKARVLPIGFELAALKSNPDKPWNLGEVVNGFEDCDEFGGTSATHPYCNLINPNWIIKVPPTRCGSEGFGPNLVDDSTPFRQTDCMDLQTCISESADGTCIAWGYCTKEKNIWKLDGEECPAEYSTCTTYTNTATRASNSYLARTIDFGQCTPEAIGCQGYSTEKIGTDWITYPDINSVGSLKTAGRTGSIYFNRNIESCPSSSEGCTAFYGVQRNPNTGLFALKNGEYIRNTGEFVRLKKAPDYLGCYDTNTGPGSEVIINWPQTEAEVINMNVPSECGKFAQVCAPSEAGCSLYSSVRTGDTVSAIVREQNGCPAECAGYETFKQRESNFEAEIFPLHFVPSLGGICSAQYAGCDEFTNVEEAFEGGENLEYYNYIRYCEKPDTVSEKSFFSWEGSHNQGFVLRNHRLKSINAAEASYIAGFAGFDYDSNDDGTADGSAGVDFASGAPAYSDNTRAAIQANFNLCNRTNYALGIQNIFDPSAASADCRQFYDNTGNEYYRMMGDTVVISDQCRRLRKSDPKLFVDTVITDGATCNSQGKGVWGDSTGDGVSECNRCYAGGQVDGNTCIYQALPEESSRCPAVANGCRAYTGNTGNNLRLNIIADDFETGSSTGDWFLLPPAGNPPSGSNLSISAESLQRGQNSLRVSNDDGDGEEYLIRYIRTGTTEPLVSLQTNGWYQLTFWARGTPQNVSIRLMQDRNNDGNFEDSMGNPATTETYGLFTREILNPTAESSVSIGNNWREYTLGPVQFTGNGLSEAAFRFHSVGSAGAYFIDNVRLSQIEDSVYLIKESWKQQVPFDVNGNGVIETGEFGLADAPATCFAPGENPTGLLPGFALGCSEYKDERNNTYYLTGFASLCRAEAVGCQPLFDTNNTLSGTDARLPKLYNAVCAHDDGSSGVECSINYFGSTGSCFVPTGETNCYIPEFTLPFDDNGTPDNFDDDEYRDLTDLLAFDFGAVSINIDLSSVYIPPESGLPIFLTNRSEFACPEGDIGCMLAGSQDRVLPSTTTLSYEYSNVYIKNNPEQYSEILCREDLIGCGEYTAGADTYYFRDPVETGNSVCVYRENVNGFDGWYLRGIGQCATSPTNYCRSNSDCPAEDCTNIGSVACYPDYLKDEIYSLWSNESPEYKGFVGSCPNKYNACTELVDPADTSSADTNGKAYYRIFDNRLTERTGECNGQVSLKDGCVLFDKTDQPNKFYNTELTYTASDATDPQFGLVNPVVSSDPNNPNDVNLLLKVTRDRECSEWLSCSNKIVVRNDKGEKQVLCSKYKACEKLKIGGRDDECLRFVNPIYGETFLDEDLYIDRDLSWYGEDYAGYSLLNKHQILTYGYFSFPDEPQKQFLGALLPNPSYIPNNCDASFGDTNGNLCGTGLTGRCFGGRCVSALDNTAFPNIDVSGVTSTEERTEIINSKIKEGLLPASCKIYSEEDSPFPYLNIAYDAVPEIEAQFGSYSRRKINADFSDPGEILAGKSRIEYSIFNEAFGNSNLCQGKADCSCEYNKYDYNNFVDYYPISTSTESIPEGICTGGEKDGQPCQNNTHCLVKDGDDIVSSGQCSKLREIQTRLGVKGFCLEPDLSRPINGKARFLSDQEYACQTWLPIQTSASNIDLFNMNVGAGYLPSLDSQNSAGDLMCTGVHRGGFREVSISGGFPASTPKNVSWVFPPPGPAGVFENCDPVESDCRVYNMDILTGTESEYTATVMDNIFHKGVTGFDCPVAPVTITGGTMGTCGPSGKPCNRTGAKGGQISDTLYNLLPNNLALSQFSSITTAPSPYYRIVCDVGIIPNGITDVRRGLYNTPPDSAGDGVGANVFPDNDHDVAPEVVENWKKTMYKIIKGFAWNKIGNNTLVLRAEIHPNKDIVSFDTTSATTNSANYTARFAPWVGFGPFNTPHYEQERDVFDKWSHPVNTGDIDPTSAVGYGKLMNLDGAASIVNENNLEAMYFIPLMYKGGLVGNVPKTINEIDNEKDLLGLPIKLLKNGAKDTDSTTHDYGAETFDSYKIIQPSGTVKRPVNLTPTAASSNRGTDALVKWSYRIERNSTTEGTGLFCTGASCNSVESGANVKYVLTFFVNRNDIGTTVAPSFVGGTGFFNPSSLTVPANSNQDPFQANCEQGTSPTGQHYNPWWAVAVNFDSSGSFLGYTTKWCTGSWSSNTNTGGFPEIVPPQTDAPYGGGISFAVVADMANQCFEFAKVNKSFQSGISNTLNKAWTNRVWQRGTTDDSFALPYTGYGASITKGLHQEPYGSVNLSGAYVYAGASSAVRRNLIDFSFSKADVDGIPYACNVIGPTGYIFRNSLNFNGVRPCPFNIYSSYRTDSATAGILDDLDDKDRTPGRTAVSRLFAMQFTIAELNNTADYTITDVADDRSNTFYGEINVSSDGQPIKKEYLFPPSIVSLNPMTCGEEADGSVAEGCSAGDFGNVTINNRTGITKDYNFENGIEIAEVDQSRAHVAIESFTANMRFFAYADDNKMPIRKVSINWRDGVITNENSTGFYKNSKPFCAPVNNSMVEMCEAVFGNTLVPSGLTCQGTERHCPIELKTSFHQKGDGSPSNPPNETPTCLTEANLLSLSDTFFTTPRFGSQPRACTDSPFEFEHPYTCDATMGSDVLKTFSSLPASLRSVVQNEVDNYNFSVTESEQIDFSGSYEVCVFKPRVQVIDNWGYCNGSCGNSASPAGTFCYNRDIDNPSVNDECTWEGSAGNTPYTEYRGNIVVVPLTDLITP